MSRRNIPSGLNLEDWHEPDGPFWAHVDSRPFGYYPHGRDKTWENVRRTDGDEFPHCMALNGQGERCWGGPVKESPFCDFHFGSALQWFLGKATREEVRRRVGFAEWEATQRLGVIDRAKALLSVANSSGERVYFYELVGQDLVKVGKSHNPEQRIKSFRAGTGCKFPSGVDFSTGALLGTIAGGHVAEKALPDRYRSRRVTGEWFRIDHDLRTDIDALILAGEFDLSIPAPPYPEFAEELLEARMNAKAAS